MKRCLAAGLAASLSGCMGTVETTRLDHRYEPNTAVTGVSYALPMLQYDVTVTHTLTGCGDPGDKDPAHPRDATVLSFDTTVKPVAKYVPNERFNVDYRKLSGLFRTSAFNIEYYPNGTIKSIGASADDKTGDAIKSAAKLAGGVIALTAGVPNFAGTLTNKSLTEQVQALVPNRQVYDCSLEAVNLLAALEVAKGELKTAKDGLALANDTVEGLARRFSLKISKDGDADSWDKAVSAQFAAQIALAAKQKALETAKEPLSKSYTLTWPTELFSTSGDLDFADRFVKGGQLDEFFDDLLVARPFQPPVMGEVDVVKECNAGNGNTKLSCLSAHLDLFLHFATDWPQPATWSAEQVARAHRQHVDRQNTVGRDDGYVIAKDTINKTLDGLLYREPARGGVVICLKKYAADGTCGNDRLVEPEMVNFPQFGQLRFIPLSVLPFQGKDQTIEFTLDGYPSKITFKSTKAAGAEALGAGADAVTSVADALEKREEERRSDLKAAREESVAELVNEIDLLEKQAKIVELRKPKSQPSEASLQLAETLADIEQKRATLLQLLLNNGIATGSIDPAILFGS